MQLSISTILYSSSISSSVDHSSMTDHSSSSFLVLSHCKLVNVLVPWPFLLSFLVPSVNSSSFSFCTVAQQHYYQTSCCTAPLYPTIPFNVSGHLCPSGHFDRMQPAIRLCGTLTLKVSLTVSLLPCAFFQSLPSGIPLPQPIMMMPYSIHQNSPSLVLYFYFIFMVLCNNLNELSKM